MSDRCSSAVEFVWRKWDGSAHWRYQAIFLGRDEYGEWFGQRAGTRQFRPGVDIATRIEWDDAAGIVNAIDMDLDVIKTADERATWIDDEDEFAERILSMAYPQSEIDAAERHAAEVAAAVRSAAPPFDGRHEGWLRTLASLA